MPKKPFIQTVTGPVEPASLGRTLIHEHLLVDFVGAQNISRDRYDPERAFRKMLPYLKEISEQGIEAFVECTPMFLGRDPKLFRRLSEASGVVVIVNTGQYAAGQREGAPEPFLPTYAYELEPEHLAGGWLKEWYEGIEGTTVKPGFIKTGVNPGEMRPISEKIVKAAAITSFYSGLAVACHTVYGKSALRILDIFEGSKVSPDRYIFVHAQGEKDLEIHQEIARRGAYVEFDGISESSAAEHLRFVLNLLEKGFENQILISQDAGWYRPGEPNGGKVRGFTYLVESFLPKLRAEGVPQATIDHLLIHNPARALSVST